jgi:hypothetical protein
MLCTSKACTHKAGSLLLEPQLQSILLWLFWKWGYCKLFSQPGFKLWFSQFQPSKFLGWQVWASCWPTLHTEIIFSPCNQVFILCTRWRLQAITFSYINTILFTFFFLNIFNFQGKSRIWVLSDKFIYLLLF